MIQGFRQFSALGGRAKVALLHATLALLLITVSLRLLGFAKARKLAERSSPTRTAGPVARPDDLASARNLAKLVKIAACHGPVKGACLQQSLAICWMLHRHGVPATLRIGVRRHNAFEAHAWVEIDGQPINDSEDVADRFTAFERLHGLP